MLLPVTVAVKVTFWPLLLGFREEVSVVELGWSFPTVTCTRMGPLSTDFAANGGSVSTVMKPVVPVAVPGFTPICRSWLVENGPLGTLSQLLPLFDIFQIRPWVELGILART